ncbi:hypothetical protein [Mesorhizobium sp. M7A.F.Ca.MR.245.00.0.0]|uniref:hypothetical protein n=1 Tax=Mesorhizobium sp. M7A.F.Ca.MR.245.00.0.0 TaxID=2496778 RepID=UPI001FDEC0F7|nr:hypothetical protein [Mesorhizobium sp. M7A.F.Ca.MR.245.00.0.0]
MTSSNGQTPVRRPDSGLSFVPVGWLVFVMAWSVYGLISVWPAVGATGLPDSVFYLIYGGLAVDIITILWGLYLLGLAFGRSARFPRQFTIWQVATIIWLVAWQACALTISDFVFSGQALAITAAQLAIGVLCIYLLRRGSEADAVYVNPETESPPVFVSVVAALLGIVLGAVIGAVGGFAIGSVIADATEMSCFEGACGYFAVFTGLAGLVIGAIGGGVFAACPSAQKEAGRIIRAGQRIRVHPVFEDLAGTSVCEAPNAKTRLCGGSSAQISTLPKLLA